jgi:hypothetical protein
MSCLYDVVVPFHKKDSLILPYCILSLKQNAKGLGKIFIVSAEDPEEEGCEWVSETAFPFTKEDVVSYIPDTSRTGWYFQQLLKLSVFNVIKTDKPYILISDSDCIMKKPVSFFEDGHPVFAKGLTEYTQPYFIHMNKVIPGLGRQIPEVTGVTHHSLFSREIITELLLKIESLHKTSWWKALLINVSPDSYFCGMAEYELYFNYCLKYHPDLYKLRPLKMEGVINFSEFQKSSADIVALHAWAFISSQ